MIILKLVRERGKMLCMKGGFNSGKSGQQKLSSNETRK